MDNNKNVLVITHSKIRYVLNLVLYSYLILSLILGAYLIFYFMDEAAPDGVFIAIIGYITVMVLVLVYILTKMLIQNKWGSTEAIFSIQGIKLPSYGIDLIPWQEVREIHFTSRMILSKPHYCILDLLDSQKYINYLNPFEKLLYKIHPRLTIGFPVTKKQEKEIVSYLEKLNLQLPVKRFYLKYP